MELQIYYYENLLSLKIRPFCKIFRYENLELSRRSWSPWTIYGKLCCHRWSPQTKYGCHGWATLPQVVPTNKLAQGGQNRVGIY